MDHSYAVLGLGRFGRTVAKALFEAMRSEGIFVRYFDRPLIRDYLRISIGTDEEMDAFLGFVKQYLAEHEN